MLAGAIKLNSRYDIGCITIASDEVQGYCLAYLVQGSENNITGCCSAGGSSLIQSFKYARDWFLIDQNSLPASGPCRGS